MKPITKLPYYSFIVWTSTVISLSGLELSPSDQKKLDAIEPAPTIIFEPSDSPALRVAKAAKVVPHPRQLAWQELEYTCFIHFGINTFTGREWGSGMEDPRTFNPSRVDADQWVRTAKAAGMKLIVFTAKHHDGYCLWQTRYNENFSVKQSPWQNGRGDVMRQLADACRKHGVKLGFYLSPADLYQIENKDGLYGNRSVARESLIPTNPETFRTDPAQGRTPPAGMPAFNYKVDDYNRYMLNQLYELLTEYGPIDEVWFDGAHPKPKGDQRYDEGAWFDMIRKLAPRATIFGGPDVRWCGNEAGHTRQSEWSPIPIQGDPERRSSWQIGSWRQEDLGSRERLQHFGDFVHWFPSEVDTSIRHGWFWRDERQHVKSAEEVFDIYERSIGGNSVLLLNIPPNRDGVFAERDSAVLLEVGRRIEATYDRPAAKVHNEEGVYHFDKPTRINRCVLVEAVATHGQQVEEHALDAWVDGKWHTIAEATVIGYKRILRFPDVVTDRLRLRITRQRMEPKIKQLSVHYDHAPLRAPKITRNREGEVSIDGTGSVYYTLDGSIPTGDSIRYTSPFPLAKGGTVNAVALREGETSALVTQRFDLAKIKWRIHEVTSENPSSGESAAMAIDSDPATLWHSKWSGGVDPLPHSITIDFGEEIDLEGFTYLPRRAPAKGGILERYRLELSRDGEFWVTASEGRFDNIENDPTLREIRFAKTYPRVRYLRLTGLQSIEGKAHSSAAEIGVITPH